MVTDRDKVTLPKAAGRAIAKEVEEEGEEEGTIVMIMAGASVASTEAGGVALRRMRMRSSPRSLMQISIMAEIWMQQVLKLAGSSSIHAKGPVSAYTPA